MQRFLLKVALFALLVFVVDKAFFLLRAEATRHEEDPRLEMILRGELDADMLIFGSSRGDGDIAPWILAEEFNTDVFNLSYGGSEIEFQNFLLRMVMEYCPHPDTVLLILDDDFELYDHDANQFRYDILYPLVEYPDVREELYRRGKKNRFVGNLLVLHQLGKASFDLRSPPRLKDTVQNYGSVTTYGPWNSTWEYVYGQAPYEEEREVQAKREAFLEFQQTCLDNGIELIYVIPPSYKKLNTAFYDRMQSLVGDCCPIYTYQLDSQDWEDKRYFRDRYHLNPAGADRFTRAIVEQIKEAGR